MRCRQVLIVTACAVSRREMCAIMHAVGGLSSVTISAIGRV